MGSRESRARPAKRAALKPALSLAEGAVPARSEANLSISAPNGEPSSKPTSSCSGKVLSGSRRKGDSTILIRWARRSQVCSPGVRSTSSATRPMTSLPAT